MLPPPIERRRDDGFTVSTEPALLNLDVIHAFLTGSYWAQGIPREIVARSIEHSLNFGVYDPARAQVGFARVISDYATFAYLGDVFILEPYRGLGLSKFLMECITSHPALEGLRRSILLTRDAHGLYAQYGFTGLEDPTRYMERHVPDIYLRPE